MTCFYYARTRKARFRYSPRRVVAKLQQDINHAQKIWPILAMRSSCLPMVTTVAYMAFVRIRCLTQMRSANIAMRSNEKRFGDDCESHACLRAKCESFSQARTTSNANRIAEQQHNKTTNKHIIINLLQLQSKITIPKTSNTSYYHPA